MIPRGGRRGSGRRLLAPLLAALTVSLAACRSQPSSRGDHSPSPARAARDRVILVAGGPSHGPGEHEYFAGASLLARLLAPVSKLPTQVVRGWPADGGVLDPAATVVLLTDGNVGHPVLEGDRLEALGEDVRQGAGLVAVHWSVHVPDSAGPRFLPLLGAYYSDAISVNPKWMANFTTIPTHPVTRGVSSFSLHDEWYYNLRFASVGRVVPLLQAVPPDDTRATADAARHVGRAETVAWAYERPDGGRSFGITGAHFHRSWANDSFRRLVVNAILWTARQEVPAEGAAVPIQPAWLDENLDPK